MYREQILDYYSRPDVQKALLELAENREVVPTLASGNYGSRPNAVFYEKDIEQLVKQGAVSFHCSVERWSNPLQLRTEMRKDELDDLRIGWDFILDIDCHRGLKEASKAAQILVEALEQFDIKSYTIKFSGSRGFHIGIPFESFPEEIMYVSHVEKDFPRIPKAIIEYLKFYTKKDLRAAFNENPDKVLSIDSAVISTRHLFRMPYALHPKTWLASVPITKDELENFDKEKAKVQNVKVQKKFLDITCVTENEGAELLQTAVFWAQKEAREKISFNLEEFKVPTSAIGREFWPPCMHNILKGLEDGRKRSVFVFTTFLQNIGWKKEDIEKFVLSWNQKNRPPLRENIVKLGFESQFKRGKPQMAPNCNNMGYYKGYGVCTPDAFCATIKNPVTYTLRKFRGSLPKKKIEGKKMRKPRTRSYVDVYELSKK